MVFCSYSELQITEGLEGVSRDPGFDQNMVWDSGKRKIIDGIRELTALREAGFPKTFARDTWLFACLSGIREIFTTEINVPAAKANQPGEHWIVPSRKLIRWSRQFPLIAMEP